MMRRAFILCLAAGLLFMAGCGPYSASSGRVDETIKRVAVQYLEQGTNEPDLNIDLTDGIILALQTDNTLKVVDEGSADSIISGRVTRYKLSPLGARQDMTVNEYQVQIAVSLSFTKRATGETIFDKQLFAGTGTYVLNDPTGLTSEETAKGEAAEEIVKDILALVVEDW